MKLLRHDLHTLTGAYALDAIDGSERERFEHHLVRCQPCEYEVRGLQETATRLGQAVASRPPAQMKARVLAAVATTRQLPPLPAARPLPASAPGWEARCRPAGGCVPGSSNRARRAAWYLTTSARCGNGASAGHRSRAERSGARLVTDRRRWVARRPSWPLRTCTSSSSRAMACLRWPMRGCISFG